jgi:hypothetical protein
MPFGIPIRPVAEAVETYGYMTDSELNLAEAVRQKYRMSDKDIRTLIHQIAIATHTERRYRAFLKGLQGKYMLTDKHRYQLESNPSTLCYFPHRAAVDMVGADGTHGTHHAYESIIFQTLQQHGLLPQGRPADAPKHIDPSLRKLLADAMKSAKAQARKRQ